MVAKTRELRPGYYSMPSFKPFLCARHGANTFIHSFIYTFNTCQALPRKSHVSSDPIKEKNPENVWGKSLPERGGTANAQALWR